MSGKRVVSVQTLVEMLRSTAGAPITSERIADLLGSVDIDEQTLRPFVGFADDHYTRHLIHRDAHFDIMTLCWQPGQGTPIHTHNGQLGWAFTTRGALECTEYLWRGCDRPENQDVAGMDCTAGGRQIKLDRTSTAVATPGGAVSRVTKRVTTHSLTVPADVQERTVSIHIYSLPFDSCVVFDVAEGTCRRRELSFDTAPQGYAVALR